MQICASTDHCYVMHIIHSGIPPILQSLLEDSTSIKVAYCKSHSHYNFLLGVCFIYLFIFNTHALHDLKMSRLEFV